MGFDLILDLFLLFDVRLLFLCFNAELLGFRVDCLVLWSVFDEMS